MYDVLFSFCSALGIIIEVDFKGRVDCLSGHVGTQKRERESFLRGGPVLAKTTR